jgi:hypothetical protein
MKTSRKDRVSMASILDSISIKTVYLLHLICKLLQVNYLEFNKLTFENHGSLVAFFRRNEFCCYPRA